MRQLWQMSTVRGLAVAGLASAMLGCSNDDSASSYDSSSVKSRGKQTSKIRVSPTHQEINDLDTAWRSNELKQFSSKPMVLSIELFPFKKKDEEDRVSYDYSADTLWTVGDIFLNQTNVHDRRTSLKVELINRLFEVLEKEKYISIISSPIEPARFTVINHEFFKDNLMKFERPRTFFLLSTALFSYQDKPYVTQSVYRDDKAEPCLEDNISKLQPTNFQLKIYPISRIGELLLSGHRTVEISECKFSSSSMYHGQPRPYKSRLLIDFK